MTIHRFPRPVTDADLKRRLVDELAENVSLTLAQYADKALHDYGWSIEQLHGVFNAASRVAFAAGTGGRAAS